MKKYFVIFGILCFLGTSVLISASLSGVSNECYVDITKCDVDIGLVLFLGSLWILSLASFLGGLSNSETD